MPVSIPPGHPVERRERRLVTASIGLVAATAWLLLWLADGPAFGLHHAMHHAAPAGSSAIRFVAGWTVMSVAMMLPTTLPVLTMLHAVVRRRSDRSLLLALAIAGYLGVWSISGIGVHAARLLAGRIAVVLTDPARVGWLAAPALLLLAGLFQLTPWKNRCLERCRSPVGFVLRTWNERRARRAALRLGVENGLFCVGCCWALMLLMLAVGSGGPGFMLALAAVMAAEKNLRLGGRLTVPVGAGLIGWGVVLLALGP